MIHNFKDRVLIFGDQLMDWMFRRWSHLLVPIIVSLGAAFLVVTVPTVVMAQSSKHRVIEGSIPTVEQGEFQPFDAEGFYERGLSYYQTGEDDNALAEFN